MASFGVAAQAARLTRALNSGHSATALIVSDSTAARPGCWPELLGHWLAARHRDHAVAIRRWSQEAEDYQPPEPLSAETSSPDDRPNLTLYNLSIGGKSTDYALGSIGRGVVDVAPDLIFVSLGLNEAFGTDPAPDADQYRAHYLALTETLAAVVPQAGMVLVLQNPETNATVMTLRNAEYRHVAQLRGCGVVDVHEAFLAVRDWQHALMQDARHPNAAGQRLWAEAVETALALPGSDGGAARGPSSFARVGRQLLENGRFRCWADTGPLGWRANNAALVRPEVVEGEFDGHGCRVASVDASRPGWVESRIPEQRLSDVRGRLLTVAARVLVPATAPRGTSGLLEIDQHLSSDGVPDPALRQRSRVATLRSGSFVWVCATRRIDQNAQNVMVRVYATTGVGPGEVTVDRIVASPGLLPRGCPG